MDSASKTYKEIEPRFEWLSNPDSHVLVIHLADFRSNQLKVQVTSTGKLRVTGERRLVSDNWLRFHKEFDIPSDTDTDKISAKLEEGVLYVKHPRKTSAVSSTHPPDQQPKPKDESQPPPAAAKPKAEPPTPASAKSKAEPPKPASAKPKAEPPTPASAEPTVDLPTFRQNAPKSQKERPQSQANGKQIPTPKLQEVFGTPVTTQKPTGIPSAGGGQPVQDLAPKDRTEKQTEEKAKERTKLKDALEKTREEEGKEGGGSKMGEEKGKGKEEEGSHERGENEGVVAKKRTRRRKRSEERVEEEFGRLRTGERFKQVIDGVMKELRTNMVTLVLGIAVFVIVYLNVTKKGGHVEEEL